MTGTAEDLIPPAASFVPSGDPIGDLHCAIDRINSRPRQPAPTVPLEFEVPALAGWDVYRAGPDAAPTDQATFGRHTLTAAPVGWSAGWVAAPETIRGRDRPTPAVALWSPPGVSLLTDLPVWESDAAPLAVLVPVLVRHGAAG